MSRIRALIVDDEPLARLNIHSALRPHQRWQIVDELGDASSATKAVQKAVPDVVFLDIQMPGKSGVECAREWLGFDNPPLIVFVTAYDHYTLQAFELFAIDYLLKPFDDERFNKTIARIESLVDSSNPVVNSTYRQQLACLEDKPYLAQIVIRSAQSLHIVRVDDLRWLKANGNYVEVVHTNGRHLQRVKISYIATRLDPNEFCRIHRSAIVALREVSGYRNRTDGSGDVILGDGSVLPVSARYRPELFSRLNLDP